MINTVQRKII